MKVFFFSLIESPIRLLYRIGPQINLIKLSRSKFSTARLRCSIFWNLIMIDCTAEIRQQSDCKVKSLDILPKNSDPAIPRWFLEFCVKTSQEWTGCEIPLIIHDNALLSHDSQQGIDGLKADVYKIDSVMYKLLLKVLSSQTADEAHSDNSDPKSTRLFINNAVHLHLPGKHWAGGDSWFLIIIVEYFAKHAGANLIILGLNNLDDLAKSFTLLGQQHKEEEEQKVLN